VNAWRAGLVDYPTLPSYLRGRWEEELSYDSEFSFRFNPGHGVFRLDFLDIVFPFFSFSLSFASALSVFVQV
jgi:hypothetical protein